MNTATDNKRPDAAADVTKAAIDEAAKKVAAEAWTFIGGMCKEHQREGVIRTESVLTKAFSNAVKDELLKRFFNTEDLGEVTIEDLLGAL